MYSNLLFILRASKGALSLSPFPIMHKVLAIKQRCYNFIHYSRENQSVRNAHKAGSAHSDIKLRRNRASGLYGMKISAQSSTVQFRPGDTHRPGPSRYSPNRATALGCTGVASSAPPRPLRHLIFRLDRRCKGVGE